jgi:hypothetical protein
VPPSVAAGVPQVPFWQGPEQQVPVPHALPSGTQAETASQLVPVQVRPLQHSAVAQPWP